MQSTLASTPGPLVLPPLVPELPEVELLELLALLELLELLLAPAFPPSALCVCPPSKRSKSCVHATARTSPSAAIRR